MYDAIVFAEVLEHLHTSPTLVLQVLTSLLKPGRLLVVQTPNAVALPRQHPAKCAATIRVLRARPLNPQTDRARRRGVKPAAAAKLSSDSTRS